MTLAIVNTALAFTPWNRSLQNLSAVESCVINDTTLVRIAVLAWLLPGERLLLYEVSALIVAAVGISMLSLKSS